MAQRVIVIHGGGSFDEYEDYIANLKSKTVYLNRMTPTNGWKGHLREDLGEGYEVVQPRMPNSNNAKYLEWSIWFRKVVETSDEPLILVGHSLGAIFLAKFLSEEVIDQPVIGTVLISPPFDFGTEYKQLVEFRLKDGIDGLAKQGGEIHLIHSKDDKVVPFSELAKYQAGLPDANVHVFEEGGHFVIDEFPEVIEIIKSL
ncbi:MAG TPA: alpha/beta hydrolase [Patescibacteria group bacterium]|nr:alpha/beta hydrolase [Patescibacteria group bacterium]|tara:strand:- start:9 stop:611 length:603 start_codon:yes stop_codon:yes gene_type:complete